MASPFDPYHKWLAIPPKHQPPNHYRLLGLEPFESDPDVIADAAEQRMAHVRTYQLGELSDLSQKILNELSAAKVCLLVPEKKAEYDEQLRRESRPGTAPSTENEQVGAPTPVAISVEPSSALPFRGRKSLVSPTLRRKPPWLPYAAVGAGAVVLVVLLAVLLPGPGSEEAARSSQERRSAEKPTRLAGADRDGLAKPRPSPKTLGDRLTERQRLRLKYAPDATEINGHFYKVFWDSMSWDAAAATCKQMGGYLACVETKEEQEALANLKGQENVVWLGGYRDRYGILRWINGVNIPRSRFHAIQRGHDYVAFKVRDELNTRKPNGTLKNSNVKMIQGFICEWDE